jgi:hypothetical protein
MPRWEVIVLIAAAAAMVGWWGARLVCGPEPGSIVVTVEPADATVLIDEVEVREGLPAPVAGSLDRFPVLTAAALPGRHTVSVTRAGYSRRDRIVDVHPGRTTRIHMALDASPDTGFELTSEPPGGLVWLDGAPVLMGPSSGSQARTDFRAFAIRPVHHVIEIRLDGFKTWLQDVEIEPGMIRKVHAVLIPSAERPDDTRL